MVVDGFNSLVSAVLKAVLGCGLEAELLDHGGYGKGDLVAGEFMNCRNGYS